MERSVGQWIDKQTQLLDWERDEEAGQLTDRITSLSAKACQSEGLSLLNLEVDSTRSALFGRCCLTLQRLDKQQIVQSFKVGDEVNLYNPKLVGAGKATNDDALLFGLIGKISQFKIDMIVDEYDEHFFEAPLRMDLRSNQKTHTAMKTALNSIQHEGMHNPLVNLLFNPDCQDKRLLVPTRNGTPLERADLWNQNLNESQQRAIQCALDTPSVAIIHGPPGTGKTSTLTELILQAVDRGMKILVCAPSNIAVDTILARLAGYHTATTGANSKAKSTSSSGSAHAAMKCALNMVRLGHPARISENILRYALDSLITNDEATEIVNDVRKDIDTLRCAMSNKGNKKRGPREREREREEGPQISFAQQRREQRQELRSLCKEARQRERAVVKNVLKRANVVLSTCVGAGSKLLSGTEFDMVVIDEAAQGLEVACWIPILRLRESGGKCVLAGDHCQLPPTIKSAQAEKGGLNVTLFERIIRDTRFSEVVRLLDTQYRMNRRISDWASHNMYHDAIKSHVSVAEHTLRDILPRAGAIQRAASVPVDGAVDSGDVTVPASMDVAATPSPTTETSAAGVDGSEEDCPYPVLLLVDTAGLGMFEDSALETSSDPSGAATRKAGSSHRNFHEAELVKQHVLSLVRSGVRPSQIGVITPYNGQLEVLRELLFPSTDTSSSASEDSKSSNSKGGKSFVKPARPKVHNPLTDHDAPTNIAGSDDHVSLEGLEIKTIDGFQGGEKECILLSLVRSNAAHTVGFLGEKRRINVAVTRAKRHLAVFCDSDTCSVDRFMSTLIDHMSSEGDHVSAEEYVDYMASGGYGGASGDAKSRTKSVRTTKPTTAAAVEAAKELKKLTSTIEKAEFLLVMEKFKSGLLVPVEVSKNAVVTVTVPEVNPSASTAPAVSDASTEPRETVTARLYCATGLLRFPPSMNSYLRLVVHECAELLGLRHRSVGEGNDRCIEVCVGELPPEGELPVTKKAKAKKAATAAAPVASVNGTPPASVTQAAIIQPTAPSSVPIAPPPAPATSMADSSDTDSDSSPPTPAPTQIKSTAKKPPAKSTNKGPQTYMGADRRSALGRLEQQHELQMKQAALQDDDDAFLEAAIQHNEKVGELHKYRVGGSGAMPNPDKVAARQKLQSKVIEAAQARVRGAASAEDGKGAGAGTGAGGGAGGGSSTGRVGTGNVFGFTSGGGSGGVKEETKPSGGGGGGGKKKVLKKPPPSFGGGVLGNK